MQKTKGKRKSGLTKTALKSLKKKAESKLHEYIRKRAQDFSGNVTCYTCRRTVPYEQVNAGHRWHGKLDLEEDNLKPCCIRCNNWLHGNLGMYERHLIEDYGIEWAKDLERRAAQDVKKYTVEELQAVIEKYTNLLKSL